MRDLDLNRHFVFIIGTRAQLIKVAPIIIECETRQYKCTLLMTGQHEETMQDLINEFGITSKPVAALPNKERATIFSLLTWFPQAYKGTLKQLQSLDTEIKKIDVLVHGDTLSTILGVIAGKMLGARIVHLESGLTSQYLFNPFPEEIIRRIVFHLCHIAMCPNEETFRYMQRKYSHCLAIDTQGNTIIDAIRISGVHRKNNEHSSPYLVASLHRFQNIYEKKRLNELVNILIDASKNHNIKFVLHPATRKRLDKTGLYKILESNKNIELIPRLGYKDFLKLSAEAACVLTDGGSNQEELATIGVPTIIMRQTTERTDGLGCNAIMEQAINGPISKYIFNKQYKELEKNTIVYEHSPSSIILDKLLGN